MIRRYKTVVSVGLTLFLLVAANVATADSNTASQQGQTNPANALQNVTAPPATIAALAEAKPVLARHGMVVTAQHLATDVGVNVLKQGGNAIDAAVAVGYALAVVHPCCGNIGGGGFMVAHLAANADHAAEDVFLDFREKAPLAATPTLFQNAEGEVVNNRIYRSYIGVGVPGTVMGLEEARKTYGTMSRAQLIAPAIRLARRGYELQQGDIDILGGSTQTFAMHPNVARTFLNHGQPYKVGDTLKQPLLAHTLSLISRSGTSAFYRGPIAKAVVRASQNNGGILSMRDFAQYTAPWGKPVRCEYHGNTILSTPPPSSGGVTICEILGILNPYPVAKWGYGSFNYSHYLIEAERRAFADRNTYLGDPAFVDNPISELLSRPHLAALRRTIVPEKATPSSEISGSLGAPEGQHTTHYSIVDRDGNAVAVTYTLNFYFGSGYIAGNTGFFLNNELGDFTAKPGVPNSFGLVQGEINQIEPGKRPLSSMSPSIVLKNNSPYIVTGSPGGSTIISTVLESMINVIDFGFNIKQAVTAPRIHNQWLPDSTRVQPGYLTDDVKKQLEAIGHHFGGNYGGADEAILRDPKTKILQGANDPRRPAGLAAGY